MHGFLRFFLSILVVLSHTGFYINDFNQGVSAVVIFFMLAGYVVTGLLYKTEYNIQVFYIDRFLRIYPTYLITLFFVSIFVFNFSHFSPKFTTYNIFSHLTIIPLDYYWIKYPTVFTAGARSGHYLNPQAWSLGLEIQVYLLLPFILKYNKVKIIAFIASILFFISISLSDLNADQYNYRFIAGSLFVFILGSFLYDVEKRGKTNLTIVYLYLFFVFLSIVIGCFYNIDKPYLAEEFIGLLVGIPMITYLSQIQVKSKISKVLGGMSYGIFIGHYLFIYIMEYFYPQFKSGQISFFIIIAALSTIYSFFIYYIIDRKVERFRFNFTDLGNK